MSQPATPLATAAPTAESLRSRASRGAVASVIGQGASQGLRLAGNLVLARLLFPEAFGLMALVNMLMFGLTVLTDFGLQPAIVRHPRGDERAFLDTAWSIGVVRGVGLWVIGTAIAWPMAVFYREPRLYAIVPIAAVSALLGGLASTKIATLTRHLRPTPVLLVEIGSQAAALVVMVAWALWRPSVWVLVVGGLVAAGVRSLLSQLALPGPVDRPRWEASARHDLVAFGKWLFVSSIFTFVAMRVDVVMLGRLLPVDTLGIYSIGVMLSQVLRDMLQQLMRFAIMPALSASHRAGGTALAANFARLRSAALPPALFAIVAATLLAPPFFVFLYDERYRAAAWIGQLAMLGVGFAYLTELTGSALLAIGDSRAWALVNGVRAGAVAIGCAVGFLLGGLPALMIAMAAAGLVAYVLAGRLLAAHGFETLRSDFPHMAVALSLAAGGAAAAHLGATNGHELAIRSLVVAAIVLVPYGLFVVQRFRRGA